MHPQSIAVVKGATIPKADGSALESLRYDADGEANRPVLVTRRQLANDGLILPSFIVVGPPRTGTTWLHEVLTDHVNLPGPTKETRFFDLHFDRGLNWYLDHFPRAHEGR